MGDPDPAPAPAAPAPTPERNLAQETADTLRAQRVNAPDTADAEVTYRPIYSELDSNLLQSELLGGKRVSKVQVGTDRVIKMDSSDKPMRDGNGNYIYEDKPIYGSTLVDDPTKRGLLDIYETDLYPRMSKIQNTATTDQRTADIADVEALGGRAVKAFQDANPLVGKLNKMAMEQLDAGGKLTTSEQEDATQAVRQSMADRGMVMGNPAMLAEALNRDNVSNNRLLQREGFAQSVAGMNLDPVMTILGRPSNTAAAASNITGQAAGVTDASNKLFGMDQSQWANYASDLNSSNQNAAASYNASLANYNAGIYSAQMAQSSGTMAGMLGMGGAAIGAVGMIA